jgi:hypothetical protein
LVLLFFCLAFTPGIGDMNTRILQWFRRGANETNSKLQRSGRL